MLDRRHAESALLCQIIEGAVRVLRVGEERAMEVTGRLDVHLQNTVLGHGLPLKGRIACVLNEVDPCPLRQKANGIGIIQMLDLPNEGNGISADTASEAIKAVILGKDRKGRRLLTVKGTKALDVRARALEGYIARYERFYIIALQNLFDNLARYHIRHRLSALHYTTTPQDAQEGFGESPPKKRPLHAVRKKMKKLMIFFSVIS